MTDLEKLISIQSGDDLPPEESFGPNKEEEEKKKKPEEGLLDIIIQIGGGPK